MENGAQRTCFAGVDIGSTMTKVVILGESQESSLTRLTGPEHRKLANRVMQEALGLAGFAFGDVAYIVATGYGRINVPFADRQVTEITCHARGLSSRLPSARTIVDIGGQDSKGIRMENGKVVDFVMNDKCAAGTGRFLEIIADALGVPLDALGELSLRAEKPAAIGNMCTVFAEQEVGSQLAAGETVPNLVAGIHQAIAARIFSLVSKLRIQPDVAVTGGGAKNIGLIRALETRFGCPVLVPRDPLLTGALGAALIAREMYEKAAKSGGIPERKSRQWGEASFFHN
jgi:predicted CoA-substrate-specific enzyme activase